MERSRLNLPVLFIVLAVFIVGVLTYVSILGENHKINRVINNYFDKLKDGMYLEACEGYSSHMQQDQQASDEERLNFNFLLELSLLKHYNLVDHYDYEVKLKRNQFWVPFVSDDSVNVSVLLRGKKDKRISDTLSRSRDHTKNFIDDLIVVVREKGTWKIRQFNVDDTAIAGIYNDVRQSIDINTYIIKTTHGFRLQDSDINVKTLTPIDKRLLRFSLYRIKKSLDLPDTKDEGASSTYPSF
jgi:hypothetical protein